MLALTLLALARATPAPGPRILAAAPRAQAAADYTAHGALEKGVPHGPWETHYPSGGVRTRGEFKEGVRTGKWEMFWQNGKPAAIGTYQLGLRTGPWVYTDEAGAKDEARSGNYEAAWELFDEDPQSKKPRAKRWIAEKRNGVFDGAYTSFWKSGARQFAGTYVRGVRTGAWSFYLADGSLESEALTGVYVDGARSDTAPPPAPDPFAIREESAQAPQPLQLAELPPIERASGVAPSQAKAFREAIAAFLGGDSAASAILLERRREAVPHLVNYALAFDLTKSEGARDAGRIVDEVLVPIVKSHGWRWSRTGDAADLERNRRTLVRWYTWAGPAKDDLPYWTWLDAAPAEASLFTLDWLESRVEPPKPAAPEKPVAAAAKPEATATTAPAPAPVPEPVAPPDPIVLKPSPFFAARARVALAPEVKQSIEAGLTWLCAHQTGGGWFPARMSFSCGSLGEGVCEDRGQFFTEPAATGLSLLALLGTGEDPKESPRSEAIVLAAEWLLEAQDSVSGRIGEKLPMNANLFLYNHAIGTLALAEFARATPTKRVHEGLAQAVKYALSARNPTLGWHHAEPPDGENDTSVTAWMTIALAAARDAGIAVPADAFDGAVHWFEQATDPESGRVGYDAPDAFNDAMTPAALYARLAIGGAQTPQVPALARSAKLTLGKPPGWDQDGSRTDLYRWFWSSQSLGSFGGAGASAWQAKLTTNALARQRAKDGSDHVGSWDPVDAWSSVGGRIYSTALVVLALEAPVRAASLGR